MKPVRSKFPKRRTRSPSYRASARAILQLQQDYADSELLAACLAMPGPYLEDLDRLLFVTELSGWQNFPIRAVLSEGVGMPIYVLNDAKASAFAQLWSRWQERRCRIWPIFWRARALGAA